MKIQTYKNITEVIKRKEELEKQFKSAEMELFNPRITSLTNHWRDKKNATEGIRLTYQRTKQQYDKKMFDSSMKEEEIARTEMEKEQTRIDSAQVKLNKIRKELLACNSNVNIDHVLEHQKLISKKTKELEKFQQLITKQQQIIESATLPIDSTQQSLKQREHLLVDIALGKDCKIELQNIDEEIEILTKQDQKIKASNHKICCHAQQTVTGLTQRKNNVQIELNSLNKLTPLILNELVMGLAMEVAINYKQMAENMGKALTQILIMDGLVAELGINKNTGFLPSEYWTLKIPRLSTMQASKTALDPERFFIDTNNGQILIIEELQQFKEALRKKGVAI